MSLGEDPYKVLGVMPTSSKEEVHKAFRTLAAKYHPDRNMDDPEGASIKFKEVTAAFEILGDDERRRRYDMYREGRWQPSFSFRSRNSVDDMFDNMFSKFFGNQHATGSRLRVKITLEEAYFGCSKELEVEDQKFCDPCKGTGSSSWVTCQRCSGRGFFTFSEGRVQTRSSCVDCGGRGSTSKERCASCEGKGYISGETKKVSIKIPQGIDNESQIRIAGEGHDGSDLFVSVFVEKHKSIHRQGHFLLGRLEVPYSKLVMGGDASFDLFGSSIPLKIPPRARPGSRFKLKGKGMPIPQNPSMKGDLVLELALKIPEVLTKEYEEAILNLMKIESKD